MNIYIYIYAYAHAKVQMCKCSAIAAEPLIKTHSDNTLLPSKPAEGQASQNPTSS